MTLQLFMIVLISLLIIDTTAQEHQAKNNANNKLRARILRETPPTTDFGLDGDEDEALLESSMGGDTGNREVDGEAIQQIVGGEEAAPGDYPYFVDLGDCAGSLIAPDLVLTAAHCGDYRGYWCMVGAYNRGDDSTEGAAYAKVTEWARHPYYDDDSVKNDFALMKIDPPVYLDTSEIIFSLNEEDDFRQGENLTVMGLGILEENADDDGVDTLRDVTVELVPSDICNDEAWYDGDVDYTMLCAGYEEGGKDSCQGDSGSPLVRKIGNQHVQVGIASWGAGCAFPQRPGIYSKVNSRTVRWIKEIGCKQWDSPSSFCRGSSGVQGVVVDDATVSCESNEKDTDFTLQTGNTGGAVGWEIINVQEGKSVLSHTGLGNRETYQTRKCLPRSPYVLIIKNFRGNGLVGGGFNLTVDGQLVEEMYDNDSFSLKVVKF